MKKRLFSILLTICMVASLFSGMTVSAFAGGDGDEVIKHKLAAGENVYKVCQKYGIDFYANYDWITQTNKITNYSSLPVGFEIYLPLSADAVLPEAGSGSSGSTGSGSTTPAGTVNLDLLPGDKVVSYLVAHKVASGETLYDLFLAKGLDYQKNIDSFMKINGLKNANRIAVGRTLYFPSATAPAAGTSCIAVISHKVVSGDATYNLCNSYDIDYNKNLELLKALNGKDNMGAIKTGTNLLIPVPARVTASSNTGSNNSNTNTGNNNNTNNNTNNNNNTNTNTGNNNNTSNNNSNNNTGNDSGVISNGKTYTITKTSPNVNQGNYSVLVNNSNTTSAKGGDTVTINATAKKGFQLNKVTATDANGNKLALNGTTFTMPNANVTVKVEFVSSQDYEITQSYVNNGSYTVTVNGKEVDDAYVGQTVKVNAVPAYGYELDYIQILNSTTSSSWLNLPAAGSTFTMPDFDVTIKVAFKTVGAPHQVIVDTNIKNGSIVPKVNGSEVITANSGDVVKLDVKPNDGYALEKILITPNDDPNGVYAIEGTSFVMPSCKVLITAYFTAEDFNVISSASTNGSYTVSVNATEVGKEVYVVPKPDTGYYASKLYFTDANGEKQKLSQNNDGYYFIMPARDSTVSVEFAKCDYLIKDWSVSGGTVSFVAGGETIQPNSSGHIRATYQDTVTIKVEPYGGYKVKEIKVRGENTGDITLKKGNKFTMPADHVIVEVSYEPEYTYIKKASTSNGSFKLEAPSKKDDYILFGDTVSITCDPKNGYRVKSIKVSDDENSSITVTDTGTGKYTFLMPATDTVVKVTFEKIP